jgi:hypothetical protein
LIANKAYDSDPPDQELKQQGIEMIAPHKQKRKRAKTQKDKNAGRQDFASLESRAIFRLAAKLPSYGDLF